jgi:sucrose-6-phosphate hydrolase SacC (GH32 family)
LRWACALTALAIVLLAPTAVVPAIGQEPFPAELVKFSAHEGNPVFAGTGTETWDRRIRERGCVMREGNRWHLWYTGYGPDRGSTKHLGYATSPDGLRWTRHPANPVFDKLWTEDMHVVRHNDTYYMVAEGRHDIAHLLTSHDGVKWTSRGRLDIRYTDGKPLSPGPYGTPTLWIEGEDWHLFYERGDRGVWLAKSRDRKVWRNVQDEPVLARGPEAYDKHAVALNQVIRHDGRYYAVYHANADPEWKGPWTTCLATSTDLVHWRKYEGNPIIRQDFSSGQLIDDGQRYRLYTTHPDVRVFFSAAGNGRPEP